MTTSLKVNSLELLGAVQSCAKFVSKKSKLPILGCVLLQGSQYGALHLSASNIESCISTYVSAQDCTSNLQDLFVCVDAGWLLSQAKLASGAVTLTFEDSRMTFASQNVNASTLTLSGEEYPTLPGMPAGMEMIPIPEGLLPAMVRCLPFAPNPNETRPYLKGVHITADGITATNAKRLGHVDIETGVNSSIVIPGTAFEALAKLKIHGNISWGVHESQVYFLFGNTRMVIRLLEEGKFPDCKNLVPKSFTHELSIPDTKAFATWCKTLPKIKGQKTVVHLNGMTGLATFQEPAYGSSSFPIPQNQDYACNERTPELKIAFDAANIAPSLLSVGNSVTLLCNDPLSMTMAHDHENSFYAMIMPVRVEEPNQALEAEQEGPIEAKPASQMTNTEKVRQVITETRDVRETPTPEETPE